jgi:hypothetical protein
MTPEISGGNGQHLRYIGNTSPVDEAAAMERKTETLNLRVTPELKDLLRLASTREHRTLSNMVEFLVREHCERRQIAAQARRPASGRKSVR